MRILLTNDDGVHAKGMNVLRDIASQLSDDVWVVAPQTEQSATSRSVTLHNAVRLIEHEPRLYGVTGTPTDSVIVGLREVLADHAPDLILSGVNRGQNLAEDLTFSGTLAAAMQGMQMGIPSLSLSMAKGFQAAQSLPWETALGHAPKLISTLLKKGWPDDVVLNINFPDRAPDKVEGIQMTRQGHRDHNMAGLEKRKHPRGGDYYWMTYGGARSKPVQGTDLKAIYDGYISITPVSPVLTNEAYLSEMSDGFAL